MLSEYNNEHNYFYAYQFNDTIRFPSAKVQYFFMS